MEAVIRKIKEAYRGCSFIKGIVLGGSRATGTATEKSDIDIGIYYDAGAVDYGELNKIAGELDDEHRDNLICREGEWGKWVNCGGWLVTDGFPVDIIMRDIDKVQRIVEETDRGVFSGHYQTGHPHAYLDVMYRGGTGFVSGPVCGGKRVFKAEGKSGDLSSGAEKSDYGFLFV